MEKYVMLMTLAVLVALRGVKGCSRDDPRCVSLCDAGPGWPSVVLTGLVAEWPCLSAQTKVHTCQFVSFNVNSIPYQFKSASICQKYMVKCADIDVKKICS